MISHRAMLVPILLSGHASLARQYVGLADLPALPLPYVYFIRNFMFVTERVFTLTSLHSLNPTRLLLPSE